MRRITPPIVIPPFTIAVPVAPLVWSTPIEGGSALDVSTSSARVDLRGSRRRQWRALRRCLHRRLPWWSHGSQLLLWRRRRSILSLRLLRRTRPAVRLRSDTLAIFVHERISCQRRRHDSPIRACREHHGDSKSRTTKRRKMNAHILSPRGEMTGHGRKRVPSRYAYAAFTAVNMTLG